MVNVEIFDNKLYCAYYIKKDKKEYMSLWSRIRLNDVLLNEAVKVVKDKFNEHDTLKAPAIAEMLLMDPEANSEAYSKLIESIYSNKDIARIVLDGYSNGGYSFLLMSLFNKNLVLNETQKTYAVDEAMNKYGTRRWVDKEREYIKELESKNITDETTVYMDIDGSVNPIGETTANKYFRSLMASMSTNQAHGRGEFDIRYYILRNNNWSIDEKRELIRDFWVSDEEFDDVLEQWKWGIINDRRNYIGYELIVSLDDLYDITYEELLRRFGDEKVAKDFYEEIEFCRLAESLRKETVIKKLSNKE